MAKKAKRALAGAAGLLALSNGVAAPVVSAVAEDASARAVADFAVVQNETKAYDAVENVSGSFRFDQSVLSPSDSVFSLFGTAATAACAAPSFAFEDSEDKFVDYYLNVG
ncbi:MAG: hypothetical protein Q4C13_07915, partial [Clostridia bacterium]|nr:hypothetical protein [Clostridia bacterium]